MRYSISILAVLLTAGFVSAVAAQQL